MKIEYVAGVSLTSGRTLEEQRKCSVSHSVLGQVIIYYECVLALSMKYSPMVHPE